MNNSALTLAKKIQNGEVKIKEVLDGIFSNPDTLNAFITLDKKYAYKRADEVQKRIDSGDIKSLLSGVPIAVKDNICTSFMKTTCGSKMLADFIPPYDATVVKKINAADMIIIGKTNMDEFAMGSTSETSFFGAVKNPLDETRVAGGSSGGSAAVVGAGIVPLAIGSDTGGSVRQPASYCGALGLKPTYGTVSRYGLIAYASSLDTVGIIGNSSEDVCALFNIIKGKDEHDSTSQFCKGIKLYKDDLKGIKFALPYKMICESSDKSVVSAIDSVVVRLKELGANVKEIDFAYNQLLVAAYYIIVSAEASSNLARYDGIRFGYRAKADSFEEIIKASRTEGFGSEVKKRIMLGNFVLSSGYYDEYYLKALKVKAKITDEINEILSAYDSLILPSATGSAPLLDVSLNDSISMYNSDLFTVPANLCGLPAVSVTGGYDENSMPVGIQFIAKPFEENLLLNITKQLEGGQYEV